MQTDLKQQTIDLQTIGEKFDSAVAHLRLEDKRIEEKVLYFLYYFLLIFFIG